jgi:MFS family permease
MTVGVLLGGLLTGLLSSRWVFLINVPIGLAVLAGTRALVEAPRSRGRLQPVDALTGTGPRMPGTSCPRSSSRTSAWGWASCR